jgi:hypothetical protein
MLEKLKLDLDPQEINLVTAAVEDRVGHIRGSMEGFKNSPTVYHAFEKDLKRYEALYRKIYEAYEKAEER